MFCSVSVKLAQDNKGLRDYLEKNGFTIYRYNTITDCFYDNRSDTHQNNDSKWVQYHCFYNGPVLPRQEVFKRLSLEQLRVLDLRITIKQ